MSKTINAQGETALLLACKNLPRTKSVVHTLLKLKANTNLATNESCSALQWAAVHGDVEVKSRCTNQYS